jgi:hypothetical protein
MMWSMGRGNNGDRGGGRDRENTADQYSHPGSAGSPDDDVSILLPR